MNYQKITECLFYLFVFLLPWQTRWIIRAGQLNGGYWEYGTYSLYATDILFLIILVLFLVWRIKYYKIQNPRHQILNKFKIQNSKFVPSGVEGFKTLLIGLLMIGLLSIYWASDRTLAFYWWLRLLQGMILVWLIVDLPLKKQKIFWAVVLAGMVQGYLGVIEFWRQNIIVCKWLGIAGQSPAVAGVSVVETVGARWLRAYGSLPHPNILAGFLVISLLLLIGLFWTERERWQRLALVGGCLIITSGLALTFSRGAVLGLIVGLLGYWGVEILEHWKIGALGHWERRVSREESKNLFKQLASLTLFIIIIFSFWALVFPEPFLARLTSQGRLESKSNYQRLNYYGEAKDLIKNNWYKGVGIGNYTLGIKRYIAPNKAAYEYQPVHNVYLLILAELSIFGLFIFLIIIQRLLAIGYRQLISIPSASTNLLNLSAFIALISILFIFLFDHYWWTLSFGISVFWLIVGINAKEMRTVDFKSI